MSFVFEDKNLLRALETVQERSEQVDAAQAAHPELLQMVDDALTDELPHLRLEAGLLYMSDPECGNIEAVQRDPRFCQVPLATLKRWANADSWEDKRRRFLGQWAAVAYERMGGQFVQAKQDQLAALQQVSAHLLGRIFETGDREVPAKSLEGLASALVRVSAQTTALQDSIVASTLPPGHDGARGQLVQAEPIASHVQHMTAPAQSADAIALSPSTALATPVASAASAASTSAAAVGDGGGGMAQSLDQILSHVFAEQRAQIHAENGINAEARDPKLAAAPHSEPVKTAAQRAQSVPRQSHVSLASEEP